jgi:hypothetical protein
MYALGLACILLTACGDKVVSPSGAIDPPSLDPIISYFTANPATIKLGEKSILSWKVDNCTRVEIDEGIGLVDPIGSIEVSPLKITTFTLQAQNSVYNYDSQTWMMGGDSKTCTVTVEK